MSNLLRLLDNDPARLIANYIELQRHLDKSKIVPGPEEENEDLIRNQRAAGREQDLLGVKWLERHPPQ